MPAQITEARFQLVSLLSHLGATREAARHARHVQIAGGSRSLTDDISDEVSADVRALRCKLEGLVPGSVGSIEEASEV